MSKIINLYNTKSKKVELFTPIKEGSVSIYSCGPTVYHYIHLGNLRAFIFADTLHRLFRYTNYSVTHVMNITDVGHLVSDGDDGEDKLEKGAKREGKSVWDIAAYYTNAFFEDIQALNICTNEYLYPKATDNISEQIALIQTLEEKGYTYIIGDGVYFDTSKFSSYATFANLDVEGLKSGARVEANSEKKNITDFALWKFSPINERRGMEWDSPWGVGFPGWHIECSAMSKKYLGNHFDIHTGGIDHIPVHHTNEIAQSECANGEHYVNYWMHNNFLNDQTGKMSKSKGDFLRMQTLTEERISPLAFRYHLLTTHYRSELAFSMESLKASTHAYTKLVAFVQSQKNSTGRVSASYQEQFEEALFDDVGTPEAIAIIWKLYKDDTVTPEDKVATIFLCDELLGLNLKETSQAPVAELVIPEEVSHLLTLRDRARQEKRWGESDQLRDSILALGFSVKDTIGGQELTKIN